MHSDALAGAELGGTFCGVAVNEDEAGIDQFLDAGAGEIGTMADDETVEAGTGIGGCGEELADQRIRGGRHGRDCSSRV